MSKIGYLLGMFCSSIFIKYFSWDIWNKQLLLKGEKEKPLNLERLKSFLILAGGNIKAH